MPRTGHLFLETRHFRPSRVRIGEPGQESMRVRSVSVSHRIQAEKYHRRPPTPVACPIGPSGGNRKPFLTAYGLAGTTLKLSGSVGCINPLKHGATGAPDNTEGDDAPGKRSVCGGQRARSAWTEFLTGNGISLVMQTMVSLTQECTLSAFFFRFFPLSRAGWRLFWPVWALSRPRRALRRSAPTWWSSWLTTLATGT